MNAGFQPSTVAGIHPSKTHGRHWKFPTIWVDVYSISYYFNGDFPAGHVSFQEAFFFLTTETSTWTSTKNNRPPAHWMTMRPPALAARVRWRFQAPTSQWCKNPRCFSDPWDWYIFTYIRLNLYGKCRLKYTSPMDPVDTLPEKKHSTLKIDGSVRWKFLLEWISGRCYVRFFLSGHK